MKKHLRFLRGGGLNSEPLSGKTIQNNKNSAFSLIELSIVLIIIGLLVAGITGGSSLIESAKIRALSNELTNYAQAVNVFYLAKNRLPGDLNKDGKIGFNSQEGYSSTSFPAPYNDASNGYGIPNRFSAPFVDLYLDGITAFQPKNTSEGNPNLLGQKGGLPQMKYSKNSYYYFESILNPQHTETSISNGMYPTVVLTGISMKIPAKAFEKIDRMIDDGSSRNGKLRAYCSSKEYSEAIQSNNDCTFFYYNLEKEF